MFNWIRNSLVLPISCLAVLTGPKAKSWVGAKGLMQVMPRTGAELKIYDLESPDQGILAGTK